jgi:glutathione S-transferase
MAKEFRPLLYHRIMGPMKRARPRDDEMAAAARHTTDPAHLEWSARVYDGEVISEAEAARLGALLYGRLRRLDDELGRHAHLVGDDFTIADVSMLPRVAMYPWIGLPIDAGEYPHVAAWMERLDGRPSFARSLEVPAA